MIDIKKKRIICAIVVFSGLFAQGCQFVVQRYFMPKELVRPAEYGVVSDHHVPIRMRDGIQLFADIYHPKTDEKTPTILIRIPYEKTLSNSIKSGAISRFWAKRGYHVVVQGTRGRYESEGVFYPLKNERKDGIDTLKWLAKQTWFDGRLGMWGGSAFGYTQWVLYDQEDPGVMAYNIQISSTSFYAMFYPGGAFSLESALYWAIRSYRGNGKLPAQAELDKGVYGYPLIDADNRALTDIPFFNDWVSHATNEDYWLQIDGENRALEMLAPVLLVGGWYDPFLPSQLNDYIAIKQGKNQNVASQTRLIIGPWAHAKTVKMANGYGGDAYRKSVLASSINWFDYITQFKDYRDASEAPVKIFVMGLNIWRDEEEWPLARATITPMYLNSHGKAGSTLTDGKLTSNITERAVSKDEYTYNPNNPVPSRGGAMIGINAGIKLQNTVTQRPDVLFYSSDELINDVEVTGPIKVTLYVTTNVKSTDFTAKLVDVHPDGKVFNVSDGIIRKRFTPSGAQNEQPEAVTIDLWPTSMVFFSGHKIGLEISSSNFPRYDRNPNTGSNIAYEITTNTAHQTVFHGQEYPSRIELPVIRAE